MRTVNVNVLKAPDDTSQEGIQIDSNQLVSASFTAYFGDNTAAGDIVLQCSNDICAYGNQAADFVVTNWVDVPSQKVTISAGESAVLLLKQCSFRWMRIIYTSISGGSSTITVNMSALSM